MFDPNQPRKSVAQLLNDFDQRSMIARMRQKPPPALVGQHNTMPPADDVERAHAHQIEVSASTMRDKGYGVVFSNEPAKIEFTGPNPGVWTDDDASQLIRECPAYVTLDDYALACYEQYAE